MTVEFYTLNGEHFEVYHPDGVHRLGVLSLFFNTWYYNDLRLNSGWHPLTDDLETAKTLVIMRCA